VLLTDTVDLCYKESRKYVVGNTFNFLSLEIFSSCRPEPTLINLNNNLNPFPVSFRASKTYLNPFPMCPQVSIDDT
jgi:hypothetical protein